MRYVTITTLSIFVLFITSFTSNSTHTVAYPTMSIEEDDEVTLDEVELTYTWDSLITRIKSREGLMLEPYNCAAGYLTIGYGHLVTERDSALLEGITEKQADSLLRHDLNYSKRWVKKNLNLKGAKLIAITNFCFAFGTSKLYRSTLYKKIQNDEAIDTEILRWVNINGAPNPNLQEEREFELWLYTLGEKKEAYLQQLSQNAKASSENKMN